jgi:formylglycine-generating enzyme required for sulfatase activity
VPHWFLSYHSLDEALAKRLKEAIERKDPASRVFFAPSNLRAGGAWTTQLSDQIGEADAFILLVGESGVGKWQTLEYYQALDRWRKAEPPFPLIVVLLERETAPRLPFVQQLHWIVTADPASEKDVARIFDAQAGRDPRLTELWRFTTPYRGLEAMEDSDSDFFFGRTRETLETLDALAAPGRLAVLIGNSGTGKSSLAQAGVVASLKRQAWPHEARSPDAWPAVFHDSRHWCFLTLKPGTEPLKALIDSFLDTWQIGVTDPERKRTQLGWVELLQDKATLSDLIDATVRRRAELGQPKAPAFFLYVDQAEELYTRAGEYERWRFSRLLAPALADPRLRVMLSVRSDFYGSLQSDEPLFKLRLQIDVAPLGASELRDVVSHPAKLLGARFEPDQLVDIIAMHAAEDSVKDAGALPLLSYTLDDMWKQMQRAGDGALRLPTQSIDLGRVLVERASRFLTSHPGAEDALKQIFTLKLATVRADGEPTKRRESRAEFSDEEWKLVSELAGHPYRLLVTANPESGETYAEVSHEAIFRRWDKLRQWIAEEREFLIWRAGLEAARRAWEMAPEEFERVISGWRESLSPEQRLRASKYDALLRGFALAQAEYWLATRSHEISEADRTFIVLSSVAARRSRLSWWLVIALVGVLVAAIVAGAAAWWKQDWLKEVVYVLVHAAPLTTEQELALKPGDSLRECSDCPEMIVLPAGSFMMGSPAGQGYDSERPQHEVAIARPLAVSKFELTFAEWGACAAHGDCDLHIKDKWGRGRLPVLNVSWDDARTYVKWLSRISGKEYRLLSEAEYEYAARAGTRTTFPWGDDVKPIVEAMANCDGCGSRWDLEQTAPVGSFAPNLFGLYDMVGNVWEWTDDCWHESYRGAPTDGSAWASDDCDTRVVRGGSWFNNSSGLRSSRRDGYAADIRSKFLGFRVGRLLSRGPGAETGVSPSKH